MRPKHFLWTALSLLLTLLPIATLAGILASTGVDTISNDYLLFVQQADRFLLGQNDWSQYFNDTLYTRVHSYAFLFPIRLALLKLSHLRVSAEIGAGFLLAVARVGMLYALLTLFLPPPGAQHRRRWLIPALSALVFSLGQISTFSYGETALQYGVTQLAILTGLWLLFRHPRKGFSAWAAPACGIAASFSGGGGLLAWPVFLLAILWTDRRNRLKYAAWLAGMALALWPYLAYSTYSPLAVSWASYNSLSLERILMGIGLPFSNQINFGVLEHEQALLLGGSGVALLGASIYLLFRYRRCALKQQAAPAVLLSAWGLMSAVQIALARQAIAPWYNTAYILFWIGLIGVGALLIEPESPVAPADRANNIWKYAYLPAWGAGLLAFIFFLFVRASLSYEDKSFYLASRSPASAACLRSYKTAPTYCEGTVFQWGVGNPGYLQSAAFPLERHRLSVFGPSRTLTLQGDVILGAVDWLRQPGLAFPSFARGVRDEPAEWSDYHHLNLLVPAGQTVRWRITLPGELASARLEMGVSRQGEAACAQDATAGQLEIAVYDPVQQKTAVTAATDLCTLAGKETATIDLSPYAGQPLWILFANRQPAATGAPARLHYPQVKLTGVASGEPFASMPPIQPANTDLSLQARPIDAAAVRYPVAGDAEWIFHHMEWRESDRRFAITGVEPLANRATKGLMCLTSRSHFYVKTALPDTFRRKNLTVSFVYVDQEGPGGVRSVDLPLLGGEAPHTYTLNLDLLNLPASACITGFTLQVRAYANHETGEWVGLEEAGFLSRQSDLIVP